MPIRREPGPASRRQISGKVTLAGSTRKKTSTKSKRHLVAAWIVPLVLGFLAGIYLPEGRFRISVRSAYQEAETQGTQLIDAPAVGGPVDVPLAWLEGDQAPGQADGSSKNTMSVSGSGSSLRNGSGHQSPDAAETRSRETKPSRDLVLFSLPRDDKSGSAGESSPARCGDDAGPSLVTYVVKEGDTLSSIALAHNTTVASIATINGIDSPDRIMPGQHLMIVKNASALVRRVAKGDTLWDIARAYGVTVDSIRRANSLAGDVIIPGQLLIIPVAQIPRETWAVASALKGSPLEWPVLGRITSGFGWRIHPISGVRHFHEGLDIAAPIGTPVRAVARGKVVFVGYVSGYGRMVTIDHGNGFVTRYAHLSSASVSLGQTVVTGQVIGYVGDSGYATGPHVHFEVRLDGEAKDPRKFLR